MLNIVESLGNGEVKVHNVKQCGNCGGTVDAIALDEPGDHTDYKILYFECRDCGAMGDPITGIMTDMREPT